MKLQWSGIDKDMMHLQKKRICLLSAIENKTIITLDRPVWKPKIFPCKMLMPTKHYNDNRRLKF